MAQVMHPRSAMAAAIDPTQLLAQLKHGLNPRRRRSARYCSTLAVRSMFADAAALMMHSQAKAERPRQAVASRAWRS
jgi:hypothetical protein